MAPESEITRRMKELVNTIIFDPNLKPFLVLLKAARNGAVYGAKVRFPHALVMIFLFRSGSFKDKVSTILKATRTHARNLAMFAFTYKACMLVLRQLDQTTSSKSQKEPSYHALVAGLVGGYTVFGRGIQSSVNQQIVIYVFARVVLGLAKLLVETDALVSEGARMEIKSKAWPVFAAASWGAVMWLFRWHPDVLQPSLRSSMVYLYDNAESWHDLRTFIWANN